MQWSGLKYAATETVAGEIKVNLTPSYTLLVPNLALVATFGCFSWQEPRDGPRTTPASERNNVPLAAHSGLIQAPFWPASQGSACQIATPHSVQRLGRCLGVVAQWLFDAATAATCTALRGHLSTSKTRHRLWEKGIVSAGLLHVPFQDRSLLPFFFSFSEGLKRRVFLPRLGSELLPQTLFLFLARTDESCRLQLQI